MVIAAKGIFETLRMDNARACSPASVKMQRKTFAVSAY
jgi:hypothetical protein